MMKKKAIKLATVSAIGFSTIAAVAPIQSAAATNLKTTVENAKKAMYAPFAELNKIGNTGKTVPASNMIALIKKGEAAYEAATKDVTLYGGKDATAYQAILDSYKIYLQRSEKYVTALRSISSFYKEIDTASQSKNVKALGGTLGLAKYKKNQAYLAIEKVYGPKNRQVLTKAVNKVLNGKIEYLTKKISGLNPVVKVARVLSNSSVELQLAKSYKLEDFEGVIVTGTELRKTGKVTLSPDGRRLTISQVTPAFINNRKYAVAVNGVILERSGFKYDTAVVNALRIYRVEKTVPSYGAKTMIQNGATGVEKYYIDAQSGDRKDNYVEFVLSKLLSSATQKNIKGYVKVYDVTSGKVDVTKNMTITVLKNNTILLNVNDVHIRSKHKYRVDISGNLKGTTGTKLGGTQIFTFTVR
ncbi:hypothetical protein [Peribacillus sp. SCS-155]|uniref:hypothetical protein n=1 Tax=Peribacillus sedimenti TaxID=3115297 RepID=UPI0039065A27